LAEEEINEVRKHINIFERKKRGENVNQVGYSYLERKYWVKVKGI